MAIVTGGGGRRPPTAHSRALVALQFVSLVIQITKQIDVRRDSLVWAVPILRPYVVEILLHDDKR